MLNTQQTRVGSYPNLNILTGVAGQTDENGRYKGCKPGTFLPGSSVLEDINSGFRGYTVSCPQFSKVDCGTSFNSDDIKNENGIVFDANNPSCFGVHQNSPKQNNGPSPSPSSYKDDNEKSNDCAGNVVDTNSITAFPGSSNFSCKPEDIQPVYPPGTVVSRVGSNLASVSGSLTKWGAEEQYGPQGDPIGCNPFSKSGFDFCQTTNNFKISKSLDKLLEKTNFGCNIQGFNNATKNINPNSLCLYGAESKLTNKQFDSDISPGFGDGNMKANTALKSKTIQPCGDGPSYNKNIPSDSNILNNLNNREDTWKTPDWPADADTVPPVTIDSVLKSYCTGKDQSKTSDGGPIIDENTTLSNTEQNPKKNSTLTNLITCSGKPVGIACHGGAGWKTVTPNCDKRTNWESCVSDNGKLTACVWGYCHPKTIFDQGDCAKWNVSQKKSSNPEHPPTSDWNKNGCQNQKNFAGVKQCDWQGPP